MNVILNMSVSVNGIAARKNDSTDFLTHGEWPLLVELAQQTGAILWGRRTHEVVRAAYGEQALHAFDGLVRMVVSHNSQLALEPGWHVATSPQQAVALFTDAGQLQALLAGGPTLNTSFVRARLINEVVLFTDSVIVGRGLPLFAPEPFDLPLHLLEITQVRDEVVRSRYQVRSET
ncbi:MAG TPA: dihydrofolate reductase family protein [Anaerolineales bacterium]|nr:dihydrofolate reductase family protein [Anaerolineales bacterium]